MEPGAALPPEIYRLDAHRLPEAKGRARRRTSVVLAVLTCAATAVVAMDAPTIRAALDAGLGVAAVAAILAPLALWSAGRRVRRSWNAFELAIGPQSLRVAAPRLPRTTVHRADVVRIIERPSGLFVRTARRAVRARVPRDIEAYRDVRARLEGWGPIARRWDPRAISSALALGAAVAGGVCLALVADVPAAVAAGLVFVAAVAILAVVDAALRPALGPAAKIAMGAVVATGLFALFTQVSQRL